VKRGVIFAAFGAIVLSMAAAVWMYRARVVAVNDSPPPMCVGGRCCCSPPGGARKAAMVAAADRLTLDPSQFMGEVREAYIFAGQNPALLAQLWCYCGCDKTDGHKCLLDCYRGNHGATCEICTQEALQAKRMSEDGSPVEQIRDALRRRFAGPN
jgi:hypothetical protein